MPRIELSSDARRDLVDIGTEISKLSGSRETARRFLKRIMAVCDVLAANPEIGEVRAEFVGGRYRSFSVGNYVIYFQPAVNGVRIARILHGARDHGELLG
jgi:toxin ParE1/3/4